MPTHWKNKSELISFEMRSVGSIGLGVDEELDEGLGVLDTGVCCKSLGLKSSIILESALYEIPSK